MKTIMGEYVTLEQSHIGRATIKAFGKTWRCDEFIGRILPGDVGKRVYLRGDIVQVENNEQRAARLDFAAIRARRMQS